MTTTITRLLHVPCTIRYFTPGPPDEQNNATEGWTDLETRCSIQQHARSESGDVSEVSSEVWYVWLPPDIRPPKSTDLLVANGETFAFRGNAGLAHDLAGRPDHIEGTCGRAE